MSVWQVGLIVIGLFCFMFCFDVVIKGIQWFFNCVMLWVVGFGDSDFGKFILGIVNGYSIIIFCNVGLNDLVK